MRRLGALTPANLRAAVWAWEASRRVRRQLREGGLGAVEVPPPPVGGVEGRRGVEALLRRREVTCLEAALVRQAWLAARGEPEAVIIGVGHPGGALGAHAWLESQAAAESPGFVELMRHPATSPPQR